MSPEPSGELDIEGEQYAQSTSYVCSPDEIVSVAPGWRPRSPIPGYVYFGHKLDHAYFYQASFIAEESTPRYYAYTAPFYSSLFHTDLGTPNRPAILSQYLWRNLVNDVAAFMLAAYGPQLTESVTKGDIRMGHADNWQDNNFTLVAIYAAAGTVSPPVAVTSVIVWATPSAVSYGTALSETQSNSTASVPGILSTSLRQAVTR